jgi:hypothetical protein
MNYLPKTKDGEWVMHPCHADIHVNGKGQVKVTRGGVSGVLPPDKKFVIMKGGKIHKVSDLVSCVFPHLKK